MENIFQLIGVVATITILIVITCLIIKIAISGTETLRHRWRIKRRFHKPPTAACYCLDCQFHGKDESCSALCGWRTADEWFCWKATPKK